MAPNFPIKTRDQLMGCVGKESDRQAQDIYSSTVIFFKWIYSIALRIRINLLLLLGLIL